MITVNQCVICDSPIVSKKTGLVAPFIAERVWSRKAFAVKLARCSDCGFMFFNPRLDESEEAQLYNQYRGESYQKKRFEHEPWYTERLNRELSTENSLLDSRRKLLASVVRRAGTNAVQSVLDFGGDQGQLIQDLAVPLKFVYDISGVKKRDEIVGLKSFDDCLTHDYDLIVCSHVLEHVAFPKRLLSQMRQLCHPGTLLYLEVPLESPFSLLSVAKRACQSLIVSVTRPKDAGTVLRPSALYLMHEHLNFFMAETLAALAKIFSFEVVASGQYTSEASLLMRGECIWCLGRFSNEEQPVSGQAAISVC